MYKYAGLQILTITTKTGQKAPLCKGGWQKSLIFDWGIVSNRYRSIPPSRLRRATSLKVNWP